jgi:hypothetical protein
MSISPSCDINTARDQTISVVVYFYYSQLRFENTNICISSEVHCNFGAQQRRFLTLQSPMVTMCTICFSNQ